MTRLFRSILTFIVACAAVATASAAEPGAPAQSQASAYADQFHSGSIWPADNLLRSPAEWRNAGTAAMRCAQGLMGWDPRFTRPPEQNWPEFQLRVMHEHKGFYMFGDPFRAKLPPAPSGTTFIDGQAPKSVQIADRSWASMRVRYTSDAGQAMDMTISRLSPAALFESESAKSMSFFGDLLFDIVPDGAKDVMPTPRYVAIPTANGVKVLTGPGELPLGKTMTEGWALVWFGRNSYVSSTRLPIQEQYHWSNGTWPKRTLAHYDVPWLFVFSKRPSAAQVAEPVNQKLPGDQSLSDPPSAQTLRYWEKRYSGAKVPTGKTAGLTWKFDGPCGAIAMMPLYGARFVLMGETEGWAKGVPEAVVKDCRKWNGILRQFPVEAREDYAFDQDISTLTATVSINYRQLTGDFTDAPAKIAPVPGVLALAAKAGFVKISQPVVDLDCPTTNGPICGIAGADQYRYEIAGLDRYLWQQRSVADPSKVPASVTRRLNAHVAEMFDAGVLAPVLFQPNREAPMPWWRFANIGELATTLEMARPYLDPALAKRIDEYMSKQTQVSPFGSGTAPFLQGARREGGDYSEPVKATLKPGPQTYWPQDYYALGTWFGRYGAGAGPKLGSAMPRALTALEDWNVGPADLPMPGHEAVWPLGYPGRLNDYLQQMIGCARLAQQMGNRPMAELAAYRFARGAAWRIGTESIVDYLYDSHQLEVPPSISNWSQVLVRNNGDGSFIPDQWRGAEDDIRTVVFFDATGVEISPFIRQVVHSVMFQPFMFLVPETGRLLHDYAPQRCQRIYDRVEQRLPSWWLSMGPKGEYVHSEATYSPPDNAWQLFLLAGWTLGVDGEQLVKRIDAPFCTGDLYYIQKLTVAADAFSKSGWTDVRKEAAK